MTDSSTSCPSRSQHHRWRGGDLKFARSIQPRGRLSSPLPALSPDVPVDLCLVPLTLFMPSPVPGCSQEGSWGCVHVLGVF